MAQLKEGSTVGGQEIAVLAHLKGESTVNGNLIATKPDVDESKDLIGGAITDVDDSVVIPTEPTFQQLADGIRQISTGMLLSPGSFEIIKDTEQKDVVSADYVKVKELMVYFVGTARVKIRLGPRSSGGNTYGRVYINDEPIGTERIHTSYDWVDYTEDIDVIFGDRVQFFVKGPGKVLYSTLALSIDKLAVITLK